MATPTATDPTFDAKAYIDKKNESEHASRAGKQPEAVADTKTITPPPAAGAEGETDEQGRLPRSARREMNRLREEAARLQGVLDTYKELGIVKPAAGETKTETKAAEDPEPARKDYADDAQYQRAVGRWEARQEAKRVLAKKDETEAGRQQLEQYRSQVQAMGEKAEQDKALFPDWAEVQAAAAEEVVTFKPDDHPQLLAMIGLSDVQAGVLYHLAKNPKEMEALLQLTARPAEQIKMFHRLEGRIERLYYTDQKAAQAGEEGDKKAATSKDRNEPAKGKSKEERAAALPAPSESASARGGSSPSTDVKPVSADGKLNPQWKQQRNEREGLRR